ncbi:MAG TPA: DUF4332 domain-containing protein [Desulfobacterales bacterium]|nr:DUF4332 domain-containing protein [Desulfobacterales bacterium]
MTPRPASILMMIVGLMMVVVTFWGTAHYIFPFYPHTYPFAWYGLVLFLDGLLWWRWNEGLILKRPREFAVLLFWSAVFWFFFELWNLVLQDWYFVGVPPEGLWPHIEAYLDFATVLPGMFLVYRLLCHLKIPVRVKTEFSLKDWTQKAFLGIGILMLILPLVFPDYFFPFVWGAFAFLLEPLCARFGARSLLMDGKNGEWTTLVRLLLAGIICGGYWELCNFWSLEKWVYTVPFFSEGKLFEMPYLGFLGFPPFCVQCFVMTNALYLLRGGRHWDPRAPRPCFLNRGPDRREAARTIHRAAYALIIVLGLFLSEWSYAKMKIHTVDSHSESLKQILQDISPYDAGKLTREGWRYPEQVLNEWEKARETIGMSFRKRIRQRLELVSLLNMGAANARLLESAGINSREKLGGQKAEVLFPELTRLNQSLRLRNKPLLKRRVVAWINAARRRSAFY